MSSHNGEPIPKTNRQGQGKDKYSGLTQLRICDKEHDPIVWYDSDDEYFGVGCPLCFAWACNRRLKKMCKEHDIKEAEDVGVITYG